MCIGGIGERPRTPVLMTATEDSGPEHSPCQVYAPASMVLLALFFLLCENSYYVMIMEKLTTLIYYYMRPMVGFMILVIILRGTN